MEWIVKIRRAREMKRERSLAEVRKRSLRQDLRMALSVEVMRKRAGLTESQRPV